MSAEDIKPGDVVRLASGGPAMTVAELGDDDRAGCCWFAHCDEGPVLRHYYSEHRFPVAALVRVRGGNEAGDVGAVDPMFAEARRCHAEIERLRGLFDSLDALEAD